MRFSRVLFVLVTAPWPPIMATAKARLGTPIVTTMRPFLVRLWGVLRMMDRICFTSSFLVLFRADWLKAAAPPPPPPPPAAAAAAPATATGVFVAFCFFGSWYSSSLKANFQECCRGGGRRGGGRRRGGRRGGRSDDVGGLFERALLAAVCWTCAQRARRGL